MSGTSMATPIVSAVAAMIKAQNPNLKPADIKQILDKSSKDLEKKAGIYIMALARLMLIMH